MPWLEVEDYAEFNLSWLSAFLTIHMSKYSAVITPEFPVFACESQLVLNLKFVSLLWLYFSTQLTLLVFAYPANSDHCCSTQLIDGDGAFNVSGIESFMKEVKLSECGLSYAVVSIMGPQSSGMLSCPCNFVVSSSRHKLIGFHDCFC